MTAKAAPRLFSIDGAAAWLDYSKSTIYRLILSGDLKPVDISVPGSGKSKTRVREDDLAAFIDHRTRLIT